jgi:site-specific DNA-methyltransferase (adenine-specific)
MIEMKGHNTLFSKASDEWSTPQWLFDMLDEEFHFDVDAASTDENTKCFFHFDDALDRPWYEDGELEKELNAIGQRAAKIFFLNPPHSLIKQFMKKAYEESLKGAVVVCLIPCRTDTQYWHNYAMMAHEIRFIMGRLKFGDSKNSAPFPSCIVVFDHSKYDKNNDPVFKTLKQPVKV